MKNKKIIMNRKFSKKGAVSMNTNNSPCHLFHSQIPCIAGVMLFMLAWSNLAFCGEIHDAAGRGDLAKVKTLLRDKPALVAGKDNNNGWTPLHWAAYGGHKDIAEWLLINNADVNAREKVKDIEHSRDYFNGITPLHLAAREGHWDVAELLLAHGADIDAMAIGGGTPLHEAANHGNKDVVELLLAKRAKVNAKTDDGLTPLHLAAMNDHKDIVELLRRNGGQD
jgi:ankyrin repeat protein